MKPQACETRHQGLFIPVARLSFPCIKIGDNKLAQWNFFNKLTDSDGGKETMKMWVLDPLWKDILAMIEKLWSSSRGKRCHETVLVRLPGCPGLRGYDVNAKGRGG